MSSVLSAAKVAAASRNAASKTSKARLDESCFIGGILVRLGKACQRKAPSSWQPYGSTAPVDGFRKSLGAFLTPLKSNIFSIVPAFSSKDPPPILPKRQLSSMKRNTEDWSVS